MTSKDIFHFYSKTNHMHQCIKFILFGGTLYMFRTVFPSIIISSRLYILQQTFVRYCCLPAGGNNTLHVSDGLSIHHQHFKTVHTATDICQTDTAVCLLAGITLYMFRTVFPPIIRSSRLYIQQQAFVKQILLSACWRE